MVRSPKKTGSNAASTGEPATPEEPKAQERKKRLAALKTEVRIFPTPIVAADCDPERVRALLIPFAEERKGPGRRSLRAIVDRLLSACALHALRGYDCLMTDGKMRAADAAQRVEDAASRTVDYLQRLGRQQREEQETVTEGADRLATILFPSGNGSAQSHLDLVRLLRKAHARAERIIAAADAAVEIVDRNKKLKPEDFEEAERLLHEAFRTNPGDINRVDLVRITAAANINPGVLWPQYILDMPALEIARFGRWLALDADQPRSQGYAQLDRSLFGVARLILTAREEMFEYPDCAAAVQLISDLVELSCPAAEMLNAIDTMDIAGRDVIVGDGKARDRRRNE